MTSRRRSVAPWEATGEDLRRRWRAAKEPELSEFEKEQLIAGKHITRTGGGGKSPSARYRSSIMAYLCGDHTKITEYLRTHPLLLYKQAELAWAIDERARPKKRTQSLEQLNRA
jgi:hypothetical protein